MLLRLAALGAIGYFGARYLDRNARSDRAAFGDGQASGTSNDVRDAGPEAMRDPSPREWTKTDQALDESFPASDPPGNY